MTDSETRELAQVVRLLNAGVPVNVPNREDFIEKTALFWLTQRRRLARQTKGHK